MTHQVTFLSEALRPDGAAPLSREARDAMTHTGTPVALNVALRYLASRRTLLRAAADDTRDHD